MSDIPRGQGGDGSPQLDQGAEAVEESLGRPEASGRATGTGSSEPSAVSAPLDLDAIERRANSYEYYWAVSADIRALVARVVPEKETP